MMVKQRINFWNTLYVFNQILQFNQNEPDMNWPLSRWLVTIEISHEVCSCCKSMCSLQWISQQPLIIEPGFYFVSTLPVLMNLTVASEYYLHLFTSFGDWGRLFLYHIYCVKYYFGGQKFTSFHHDGVADLVPLCSVYQAQSYESNPTFLAQFSTDLAHLGSVDHLKNR